MSDYKIQLPRSEKSVSKRTVDCSSQHGSVERVHRPRFFANSGSVKNFVGANGTSSPAKELGD